jgi:predicted XRE-type DNA-binding protein
VDKPSSPDLAGRGLEEPEQEWARVRLSSAIAEAITTRGWPQRRAAEVLAMDRPRVSSLVRRKTSQSPLNRLIEVSIETMPWPMR